MWFYFFLNIIYFFRLFKSIGLFELPREVGSIEEKLAGSNLAAFPYYEKIHSRLLV